MHKNTLQVNDDELNLILVALEELTWTLEEQSPQNQAHEAHLLLTKLYRKSDEARAS